MEKRFFHDDMEKGRYIVGVLGIFCIGIFIGIVLERHFFFEEKIPFSHENQSPGLIPVIQLQKIENGILYGISESSEIRLKIGKDSEISVYPSGNFSTEITEILPNLEKIPAPKGMQFVASKSGKYFYPLDHTKADTLAVKNRIFFANEEEAMQKGYKRGK